MKRTLYVGFILVLLAGLAVMPCSAVDTSLDFDKLQACAEEGMEFETLEEVYEATTSILTLPDTDDYVMLYSTKGFARIIGWMEWQKFSEVEADLLEYMAANPNLYVTVYAYGDEIDFASDVNVVLIQGNRVIQPSKLDNPDLPEVSDSDYAFEKQISVEFAYGTFDPDAATKIAFVRESKRYFFEVDLSEID